MKAKRNIVLMKPLLDRHIVNDVLINVVQTKY